MFENITVPDIDRRVDQIEALLREDNDGSVEKERIARALEEIKNILTMLRNVGTTLDGLDERLRRLER